MPPFRPAIRLFSPEWAAIHLAAPPLPPDNPLILEPSRLYTRTVHPGTPADEQALLDYHTLFYNEIAPICNAICHVLGSEETVHGMGPDKAFFRAIVQALERVFSQTGSQMDHRDAVLLSARGLQSKLRWDIERHPNAQGRWRTVDAFILEVLSRFHAQVQRRNVDPIYLWTYVAPLRYIHIDLLAWVAYCTDPSNESWKSVWLEFERLHGPAVLEWEAHIRMRSESWVRSIAGEQAEAQREVGKERFVPRARKGVSRF